MCWKFLRRWITKLYLSMKCIFLCSHSSPAHPMSMRCARVYCNFAWNHTSILIGGNLALHISRSREWYFLNLSYRKFDDLQHVFFSVMHSVFVLFHFYFKFLYWYLSKKYFFMNRILLWNSFYFLFEILVVPIWFALTTFETK